jgi:hypothetical protein
MLEIWTQNRIYRVDAAMTCLEVRDRATGKPDPEPKLVGALLTGGQTRPDEDVIDIYYPFPVPGSSAYFKDRNSNSVLGRTSPVERVVLCLHKVRMRQGVLDVQQDLSTGRFGAFGPR